MIMDCAVERRDGRNSKGCPFVGGIGRNSNADGKPGCFMACGLWEGHPFEPRGNVLRRSVSYCRLPEHHVYPPPPFSKRPCLVSGGGGGRGNCHFPFSKLILRFSCVFAGWTRYCCGCIAVYFKFVAWKALRCSLCHAEHLVFRNFSLSPGAVVNFQRSDGKSAKILGPSERSADYRSITYERSCTYDCARTDVLSPCADTPMTHLSSHNAQPGREKANWEEGAVEVGHFFLPLIPLSLVNPAPKRARNATVAHWACCSVDLICIPAGSFLVILWFTCPCSLSCFVLHVLCLVIRGGGSLGVARKPSHTATYWTGGGDVCSLLTGLEVGCVIL